MRKFLFVLGIVTGMALKASAQTDVTSTYMENADFGARFAAWVNAGSFTYNTATTFAGASGEVWMEKWVSSGNRLGSNAGMYQDLKDLPEETMVVYYDLSGCRVLKPARGIYVVNGKKVLVK